MRPAVPRPLLTALAALLSVAAAAGEAAPAKPVTDFLAAPAADVRSAGEAWTRARELEQAADRGERDRLCAALPYYLFVAEFVDSEGERDRNAAASALRIAEIVERCAANNEERLVAGKYYLVAAFMNLGSSAWEQAERLYLKAGQGRVLVGHLRKLSERAAQRAEELAGSAAREERALGVQLKAFSGAVAQRAGELAAEPDASDKPGLWDTTELPAAPPRVSGWLELRDNTYLREHPQVEANDVKRGILHLEGQLPVKDALFVISGEYVGDYAPSDKDGHADLVEAYADVHLGDWDLRVGSQIFSWGSGVLFNPTDNVGRWDSTDPFNAQRRGVPAALVRYNWGASSLEGAVISGFEATRLPQPGDRFFIYSPATVANPYYPSLGPEELDTNFTDEDFPDKPEGVGHTEQYALRLRTSLGTWDLALSYFKGYENIPLSTGRAKSLDLTAGTADLVVEYYYPREEVFGLDVAGTIGKLGLHAEAAKFDMKSVGGGVDVGVGDRDYVAYLVGCSYPFEDVFDTHDLLVSLEYAGEIKDEEDDRIYINRPFQDSVLARLKYTVDYRLSFDVQEFYNLGNKGTRTYLGAEYRWSDYVAVTGGVDIFSGPPDTFFGAYDDNDRVFLGLKISF